jgi:NAD(P)-dependent dehydrogenase (short-subunit alcohol dehydrogenase family)
VAGLLAGHLALITGAGSGIGRAIAEGYAAEGARVIAADLNAAGAAETAAAIRAAGGTAWDRALDVTDRAACFALAASVARELGQVSVLVNNAGINRRNPVTSDAEQVARDWEAITAVNLDGVFHVTQAFLDQLRATKGRIVNMGSMQSFLHVPFPSSVAYTAAKHGVLGLTRALAAELGAEGIRVNAIGPGLIETPLNAEARAKNPALVSGYSARCALGRTGKMAEVVGPAVFLASDMAAYVSGTIVLVDGGYSAR